MTEVPINIIIYVILGLAATAWLKDRIQAWLAERRRKAQVKEEAMKALGEFNAAAVKLAGSLEQIQNLPKYLEGLVKVCEAMVMATEKHRQSAEKLAGLILTGQDAKESLQTPTEEDADRAFRTMQKVSGGMSVQEAVQEIEDEDRKRMSLSPSDL